MLVFTVVILLFSGLVYFSIVNFSHQRFYELLKIRATTIIQIEKSKPHIDTVTNQIISNLTREEELPMEKDYVFEIPKDSNYNKISHQIHIPDTFFKSIVRKGVANYNYWSKFPFSQQKLHCDCVCKKPLCRLLFRLFEENADHMYDSGAFLLNDFFFLFV